MQDMGWRLVIFWQNQSILIIVGIVRSTFSSKSRQARDKEEQRWYKESYRMYYGKEPKHRISRSEMAELDELEDEDYEEE